ncbi:hypothetical protein KKHFBJBL_01712 [Brevundimonas sp. NIBR11]|nr:hypothetical protein KKHFBJBL_01712 [Brevundimonas sp. NIBR11]
MIALWIAAAAFVALVAAKVHRVFTAPHDPEDYYDC